MQSQKSESDVEDDNIWRLVAKDPERVHRNVAPAMSRGNSYSSHSQSSRRRAGDRQKSQSSVLSYPKKSRKNNHIAVVAGVLGVISCLVAVGVYKSVHMNPHQQHHAQQQASASSQSLSVSIASTSSSIIDEATNIEPDALGVTPSGPTPLLRSPAGVSANVSAEVILKAKEGVLSSLKGFKSLWQHPTSTDTPVLLNIGYELTGAKPIKNILWNCHHLTLAGENARNIMKNYPRDKVEVVSVRKDRDGLSDLKVVNVNTMITSETIRAKKIGLAASGLADVMVVRNLYDADGIFDESHQGRLFTMFRHPMHSAWGAYHALEYTHPHLKNMTFDDYVESKQVGQNWMTRALNNLPMDAPLNGTHYLRAVEVIHQKVLIGLESQRGESLERFERFFGWAYKEDPVKQEQCRTHHLTQTLDTEEKRAIDSETMAPNGASPEDGERMYGTLLRKNHFDVKLYDKVLELFESQKKLVAQIPHNFRVVNSTCCKCDLSC